MVGQHPKPKTTPMHKSGFVNIIGQPNVGKSTLMNALVGERMSIITNKPQTTRHRIIGIVSDDNFQIVFSDTPGIVKDPTYKMHDAMNRYVNTTFEDGDVMLFVTSTDEQYAADDPVIERLKSVKVPLFLVLNKIDLASEERLIELINFWNKHIDFTETIPISALEKKNTEKLLELILNYLPEGPVYYPKDQLTDRPERFFVAEIIREKILEFYHQEVPYSCEVLVVAFQEDTTKDGTPLIRISAEIFVARKTQKAIIIGKGGTAIKRLGTAARIAIEAWLEQKVFLELHVKIKDNWRDDERMLQHFGYDR
jgi:GTP-binding protein Era